MNPILDMMRRNVSNSANSNPMLNVVNAIRSSGNPNAMLQMIASKNPNVANTLNLVNQYGGDPKRAFYEEAKKKGVDPNQILGLLK